MMEAIRTPGVPRTIAAWLAALVVLALVSAPALTRSAHANGVPGDTPAKPVEAWSEREVADGTHGGGCRLAQRQL